jgi:hypothetical protein
VITCKHCGTELPDQARFCLQCGNPVEPEEPAQPESPAPQPELDFVQPALAGGMFLGVLSSIPFINLGNALCCMWVMLGGGVAAVLLARQRPSGITYGDGAFTGVLSGLFGAVAGTLVQMSFHAIFFRVFESQQQELEQTLQQLGIQGQMRDVLLRLASGEISAFTLIVTFFSNLIIYSLFAMVGGILTVAILNKRMGTGKVRGK